MALERNQVQELLEKKPKKSLLERASDHESRLKLHSETSLLKPNGSVAYSDLMGWVQSYLTKDKFRRFNQLLRTPFVSLEITQDIYTELARIFDGQNPFYNYEFKNPDLSQDFQEYLNTVIKDKSFFRTKGFDALKYAINSVLVVDLPQEQEGSRPAPFYYFIDVSTVIDVKTDSNGTIQSIIFKKNKHQICVYDSESYRVFNVEGNIIVGEAVVDSAHDLGYCPASFFWDKDLKEGNNIEKKSPLTDVLGRLDKYLVEDTFKEYADLYSTFPIITSYEEICSFKDCDGGFVSEKFYEMIGEERVENSRQTKCPECSGRDELGPGSIFEVPAPQTRDDVDLGSNSVNIVSPDTKSLEYIRAKLIEYASIIKSTVIGTDTKIINDQAINEIQVMGTFESRRNVLINVKESFEKIQKFGNDTIARLRYGSEQFLSSVVFYGDEFYLKSIDQLMGEYEKAKLNGEPDEEIDLIYRQIIMSKYKGNDDRIQRSWILLNLNPEPHKTVEQSRELKQDGSLSQVDFVIKSRFNNFVMRFEREQSNILDFGRELTFEDKISKIYEEFEKYANESIQNSKPIIQE